MADFENLCVCTIVINVTTVATTEQLNYIFVLIFISFMYIYSYPTKDSIFFIANYTEVIIY